MPTHPETLRPRLRAIVAMDPHRVIGKNGALPWHFPEDLKFFKRTTMGNAMVMGRKTWDSIGRPLPGRTSIVLSRSPQPLPEEVLQAHSLQELFALELGPHSTMDVIGGAEIYALLLPHCHEVILTQIREPYPGDTFLPPFESDFPEVTLLETHEHCTMHQFTRNSPSPA
ncbi:MAG: dihydrofolate reductase [Verrucomicrobiota bacterium]